MELPIKKAVLDPSQPNMGLQMISLVADPAIQINWIKFDKQNPIKLAIQNTEKRIIFTPVLIPNQLIYRNIGGEEFNLMFDADTIEQVALKWQKDSLASKVDTEHTQQLIQGVTFFESVILNKDRFALAKGFEKLPEGTWFLTGKVDSDEVWAKIQAGEVNGVSIDGLFSTMNVQAMIQIKLTEVKQKNDNSLFINGEVAVGSEVYYNRPQIVLINGTKSEIKNLVWENQITLEDDTIIELSDGKIIEIQTKVQVSKHLTDKEIKSLLSKI